MFRAQVSQIVLSAQFTILRLITIVWGKTWKISYLRKFSSQVTQIVSSAHLPVLRLITFVWSKISKNLISLWVQWTRYHKSCSQLIWPFFGLLQLYEVKLQKSHISVSLVHKYRKSCSQLIWPFCSLLQLYEVKLEKSHISVSSVHKYRKSCSQLIWPFLRLITTVWGKTSKISYLREFQCTSYHKSCSQLILPFFGLLQLYEVKLEKSHISVSSVHKYHKSCPQLIWVLRLIYNCMI